MVYRDATLLSERKEVSYDALPNNLINITPCKRQHYEYTHNSQITKKLNKLTEPEISTTQLSWLGDKKYWTKNSK